MNAHVRLNWNLLFLTRQLNGQHTFAVCMRTNERAPARPIIQNNVNYPISFCREFRLLLCQRRKIHRTSWFEVNETQCCWAATAILMPIMCCRQNKIRSKWIVNTQKRNRLCGDCVYVYLFVAATHSLAVADGVYVHYFCAGVHNGETHFENGDHWFIDRAIPDTPDSPDTPDTHTQTWHLNEHKTLNSLPLSKCWRDIKLHGMRCSTCKRHRCFCSKCFKKMTSSITWHDRADDMWRDPFFTGKSTTFDRSVIFVIVEFLESTNLIGDFCVGSSDFFCCCCCCWCSLEFLREMQCKGTERDRKANGTESISEHASTRQLIIITAINRIIIITKLMTMWRT